MPVTPSGLFWDSRGPKDAPAVLLIEGHTAQMIGWREPFCDALARRGLRVLRMDNRDAGFSRHELGGYDLRDMADDVRDVISDAGVTQATLVGQSMGGMIAQHTALRYPDVVAGLVLFYTTPNIVDIHPDILTSQVALVENREDAVEAFLDGDRATASPAWGYDEAFKRELANRMYDRDPSRRGYQNQRDAIARMPDLTQDLQQVAVPTAIIHGRADAMISPRGSERIAQSIAHSELHLYPGMGHEVAPALWDDFEMIISRIATSGQKPIPGDLHLRREHRDLP
ncbi:alpha/beta hydrolase [Microbacterium sp. R1]|uniref:alpha/beta fold hydrolase n=1 Tax=Microbacterium TaxID=33882 RepID=UPI0007349493|nr:MULTISPECIES: alpha/beta hydrolase [Microbacterium]MBE7955406.1 alpha/beta hydrolase [Microbacterium sp. R1]